MSLFLTSCSLIENSYGKKLVKEISLISYQKEPSNARTSLIVGTLVVRDGCIYLNNNNQDVLLVFPKSYQLINGNLLKNHKIINFNEHVYFSGSGIEIDDFSITKYQISENKCLNYLDKAWLIGQ